MTTCKGCGREIRWVKTEAGRPMPVDAEGVHFIAGGGPDTFITKEGKTLRGQRGRSGTHYGYIPHWATCPMAGHFRKGGTQE